MDIFKLRVTMGANDFEAEGSQEYVEKQFDIFIETLERFGFAKDIEPKDPPANKKDAARAVGGNGQSGTAAPAYPPAGSPLPISLESMRKIAHQDGDLITLTALPTGETAEADGLMLLLLAHKAMRSLDSVPTDDVLAGMRQSGYTVERLDRIVQSIETLVIRTGVKRGTKYRLTNPGMIRAKAVAEQLIGTVA